jgi:putative methyltransferase (TIGR04325 family)
MPQEEAIDRMKKNIHPKTATFQLFHVGVDCSLRDGEKHYRARKTGMLKDIFHYAKYAYKLIRPDSVNWSGDYSTWEEAASECVGYSENTIIDQTFKATHDVILGRGAFCRDGVVFSNAEYNWPLIAIVQRIHLKLSRRVRVLDFGGAFGDIYLQNRKFLESIVESWEVIEQEAMLRKAKDLPPIDRLKFTELDAKASQTADLIVLSSVLQYLPDYRSIIDRLLSFSPSGIFLDRTGFVEEPRDTERITKQIVRPPIYEATYPCRFFVKEKLESLFLPYRPLVEWNALDSANIPSHYLGIYFEIEKK